MQEVALVFPNQLFEAYPFPRSVKTVYVVEEYLFFRQYNFHKQKLVFHRASMQSYMAQLKQKGLHVNYLEAIDPLSDIRQLMLYLQSQEIQKVHYVDSTDNWLEKRIRIGAKGIRLVKYDSPLFLNTWSDLDTFFKPEKKRFFQTTFYKQQRRQRQVLVDIDLKPIGGNWTYDKENRKKYPKQKTPPPVLFPEVDKYYVEAVSYVEKNFPENNGSLGQYPMYPYDSKGAKRWFDSFLQQRFHEFGPYEDAIVKEEMVLHHSLLSPLLNAGLLTPQYVLDEALLFGAENKVPINSLEGFVRQIMGWREFIRGVYEVKGGEQRTNNFWGFHRKIPPAFYTGETGIPPIDITIKKVLGKAYCHHIERLMVLGNFMLLCEFDPDEVYRWFMELFIDAFDWVMVPNVYGMSQFADGGLMSTKPYISSSNYIMKMSNFQKGDWQKTWDGLFWRFISKQRTFFDSNPRLSLLLRTFDKMPAEKKEAHLKNASSFLNNL